jgi:putative alpha-1,2-mannosidase
MLPIVGGIGVSPGTRIESYQVGFSHANEQAVPGFYRVGLNNGVNVELTATRRTGFGRFTWPATNDATLILNTGRNGVGARSAQLEIIGNDAVQGFVETGGVCGGGGYFVYFHGEFDRPFASFGTYQGDTVTPGSRTAARAQLNGGWVRFAGGGPVRLRIGVSYVSTANAKLNMETENPNWDFDGLKQAAQATWNTALNKIQVTGGSSDDRVKFYTALYHSLLHPNLFSDVNHQYIGFDNRIYATDGSWDKYATFSGWDIYRSQVQLIGWLAPKEASDMAQSMVVDAQMGGGGYPKWPTANDDTCVMVGDAGAVIVANFHLARGYIPMGAANVWGPSATTLEYALADSAIGHFAAALGNTARRDAYFTQAQNWKPLFSGSSGYIHPRSTAGSSKSGFDRSVDRGDFVEGNSAQYTWMVPQNYRGLIDRMGGNAAAIARLDEHFTKLDAGPSSPYAFMGNEPEHGTPWAYNFAGAPHKTQAVVRRILTELFRNSPDGLTGNDDLGATSAWYVWGALGAVPGDPGPGRLHDRQPAVPERGHRHGQWPHAHHQCRQRRRGRHLHPGPAGERPAFHQHLAAARPAGERFGAELRAGQPAQHHVGQRAGRCAAVVRRAARHHQQHLVRVRLRIRRRAAGLERHAGLRGQRHRLLLQPHAHGNLHAPREHRAQRQHRADVLRHRQRRHALVLVQQGVRREHRGDGQHAVVILDLPAVQRHPQPLRGGGPDLHRRQQPARFRRHRPARRARASRVPGPRRAAAGQCVERGALQHRPMGGRQDHRAHPGGLRPAGGQRQFPRLPSVSAWLDQVHASRVAPRYPGKLTARQTEAATGAGPATSPRICSISSLGVRPNMRLNSRLNCDTLS